MFSIKTFLFLVVAFTIVSHYESESASGGAATYAVYKALKQLKPKRSLFGLPPLNGNDNDPHDVRKRHEHDDLDKRFMPGMTPNWLDRRSDLEKRHDSESDEVAGEKLQGPKKRHEGNDEEYYEESSEMPEQPRKEKRSSAACKEKDKGRRFLLNVGCASDYKLCECYTEGFARCTPGCTYKKAN